MLACNNRPSGFVARSQTKKLGLPALSQQFNKTVAQNFVQQQKTLSRCQQPRILKSQAAGGDIVPIKEEKTGIEQFAEKLATLFPLWVFIGATIGITNPPAVTWLDTDKFTYGLGFLMLSMGLTLTFDDFRKQSPAVALTAMLPYEQTVLFMMMQTFHKS